MDRKRSSQYNKSSSPRYRPQNRSKYDQPQRKVSPVPKKTQRNRSYSPEENQRKLKRDGYRRESYSPENKRNRSVTPKKRSRNEESDAKAQRKPRSSPDQYDNRSRGKDANRRGSDEYKQSKRRKEGKRYKERNESRSSSPSPQPPQRTGSRKKHHDIDPSEIRININTAKPSPPRNIFNVEALVIPRRKDEGTKPIFDRPELRQRSYYDTQDNMDEERRVVSVKNTKDTTGYMPNIPQQKQHHMEQVSNVGHYQSNNTMFQYSSLSNQEIGITGAKYNQNPYQAPPPQPQQHQTYNQIDHQPHNVVQGNLQPQRNDDQMYGLPTGDLRHCIKSRRSPNKDHSRKESSKERSYQRSRSKSQQGSRKMSAPSEDHSVNDRLRKLADQSENKLPNFRKELNEIEKWKFDPTSIPRSNQYFEHDDRERTDKALSSKPKPEFSKFRKRGSSTFRGFSRGSSFAGRGFAGRKGFSGRGSSRGTAFFNRGPKRSSPSWKHDMYDGKKGSKTSKVIDKRTKTSRKEHDKRSNVSRK
ncbi:uncharacterized protein [Antedon mediterranea]